MAFENLFPQAPSYMSGLLGEDELNKLKQQAQTEGLLGMGLSLLASSGPSTQRQSPLQGLAQGIMAGRQASQGAYQNRVQDYLTAQKIRESMMPKTVSVKADETIYQINPQTNKPEVYLQGQGSVPSEFKTALAFLGFPANKQPTDLTKDELNAVNAKMREIKEAGSQKIAVNTADPTAVAKAGMDVTKQYTDLTKDARERASRFSSMVGAYNDPKNPATDSALIYNTAKILDPTGAVQQGDLKTIIGNPKISDTIRGYAQKLDRGGSLTPDQRDDLIASAYAIIQSDKKVVQPYVNTYRDFATSFKVDPNKIQNPYEGLEKPKTLTVPFGNKRVKAKLAQDGFYYVESNGQYYKVSE